MVSIEDLLDVVAEISADSHDRGQRPVLTGGLAVHVRLGAGARPTMPPEEMMIDPVALASTVRSTQDIDLCVRRAKDLVSRLAILRFTPDAKNPARFWRGNICVDVLTPSSLHTAGSVPFAGIALAAGMSGEVAMPGRAESATVATSPALVVTKSHAWFTRRAERDLVDLARLALADLRRQELPAVLADLLSQEDRLHELFQAVLLEFASPDARGPHLMFQALLAATAGVNTDQWSEHEPSLRETVAVAVQQMFGRCNLLDPDA